MRRALSQRFELPPPPRLATARQEYGEKGSEQAVKKVSKKRIAASKKKT